MTAFLFAASSARAELCNPNSQLCPYGMGSSSSSSAGGSPTRGNKVRINPSAVPTEKTLGLELIYFDNEVDFALVKGLGRVGAAISPSNSEETFFGPPGFENLTDTLDRKMTHTKFPSQKITLATAVGLLDNKRSGMNRFEANLGVMGKYNKETKSVLPGGGISGVVGPFTFGFSHYRDETLIKGVALYPDQAVEDTIYRYWVETYSIGIFLDSLALDYSYMKVVHDTTAHVSLITTTLLLKKAMLTASLRRESSDRPAFNYDKQDFEVRRDKNELFLGVQYAVFKPLMLGVFYNYYNLHDISIGATIFF